MPLYEYRCESCKQVFEKLVPAGAGGAPACPECGAAEASRLFSTFAQQGSGSRAGVGQMRAAPTGGCCGGGCGCR